jgi:putative pyoverdin transport system ATP-binding/permease protein
MLVVLITAGYFFMTKETKSSISEEKRIAILVKEVMKKAKVPGVSITIINKEKTQYLNYGYENKEKKQKTSKDVYYELGSMSKAYTALGILLLEDEGKLSLDDSVTKYLPWFHVSYNGLHDKKRINQEVDLTLYQLLHHTSGIPFKTIGDIPEGNTDTMLYETVSNINGIELDYYPGDRFQYATINYDILGLIIQEITGQSYEEFIKQNILTPLGLTHTCLFKKDVEEIGELSSGYKITRFRPIEYKAPIYRGNTPAGYIYSNSVDMERWLRIQMGLIPVDEQYKRIIDKSHIGDITVNSTNDYLYGGGWSINIKGNDIRHGGSNPTYSSMIIMKPEDELGICVLTNLNSNAADYLAENILNIIEGKKVDKYKKDSYLTLDMGFTLISIASVLLTVLFLILIIRTLYQIIKGKRPRLKMHGAKLAGSLVTVPLIFFGGFCIYYLPNILFQRLSWKAVNVWGSEMIQFGCISGFIAYSIFMLYILLAFNFIKKDEKNYFTLVVLSLLNGVTSAMIIFTINESFNRNLEYSKELLIYFVFSLVFYIYTYKLLQGRIIVITNELTYEKRVGMIRRILSSSYQSIEKIGSDRIFSGLNNDCSAVAQIPELIVGFASNLLTLFFCLFYLLTKNVYAFLASLCIILINGILALITSRIASKYWEQNRDIQDTYFNQMADLVNGFKELVLNRFRRSAFWGELKKYSKMFSELNQVASIKFLDFKLYNILLYNVIFGVVVFIFPIFVTDLRTNLNQLRENLFIVFYMVGPFGAVTSIIPQLTKVRVNVKRIDDLLDELDETAEEFALSDIISRTRESVQEIHLTLKDVVFQYPSEEADNKEAGFTIGPVSFECCTGELVFITGGNGSGKSTLGKLVTGLYVPQSGEILLNEKSVSYKELNELFASVFSDFNLFKKLYGIDYLAKKEELNRYLTMMGLSDKVEINEDGEFLDINLSTGQKKRLAFVVSCLEDKPMLIFDEWAAEQDPQFRQYFYEILLPMLKSQGKGIIVISHDDRYFDKADKLIKLERGKLVLE